MKKIFKKPVILALLTIIGLIFINGQGLLKQPKDIFFRITAPLQKSTYQISLKFKDIIDLLKNIKRLNSQNIEYQEENRKLKGELAGLKETARENKFLRQQIDLPEQIKGQLILADVIGQSPANLGEYILIDKGEKDGLKAGETVIAAGNLLVGRISQVSNSTAKVLLITYPGSRVNALIQESGISGIIRGGSYNSLIMDWIAQDEKIESNQTVITSGLANLFPKGIFIGQIEKVISSQPQVFKEAIIRPAADFGKIDRVFVIR
ncbi:MAG: rod shape-determining protein MreC [Candidatus Portnoybacteria bacterium RIFCSPLOWO2_01_FULL_43_11]|uniref:Cell shape-determining protein MreC n=3 Tax=Candidatus Portnoyibacteriota TaxID=1817913 RepID=A0A1G2FAX6_9BACT|nr:MAG: rod shape-determining protein MreC [Candidatus Portnoybacteria bacterium RIFCSPHIGHO2_01_FULL_40_12b]OGZ36385.1 MAG: rod shape-determining protein MreC [Candidatus Portnoybacteria bacterium RIFCSPHIGHO2_02_FULL_40_23]OGZ38507.1 MAG: rod shape-determining protein MreC [Candidatus Portnoybacteria bacterium RIFCSPLOWO2_01_FULL_43_11]OGZ40222.1 MAG: rod shape-determining protein MreC [Candidatus Portnoybacteria bacterium RIFCSPLOWO2_02_FULL_40_15]